MFTKYDKLLVALLGAVVTVVETQYSTSHWVQVAVAVLTALGVYSTPNKS